MTPKKLLKYVVIAVVGCNLAIIAVVLWGAKSEPPERMPNPNGYDDFVKAGRMLTGDAYDFYQTNNQRALADFVSTNGEVLKLLRLGLSRECRVSNDLPSYDTTMGLGGASRFQQLGFTLCDDGKIAELNNRTADAAKSYVDAISFGVLSSQSGVLSVKMVGMASEVEPCKRLASMLAHLDASHCREVAQAVESLNAKEYPAERIIREEKAWIKRSGLKARFMAMTERKMLTDIYNRFSKKYQTNRLQRIKLMVSFAERAFELEKGRKPQNLQELVPEYLKAVPIDPITGTNMAFVP